MPKADRAVLARLLSLLLAPLLCAPPAVAAQDDDLTLKAAASGSPFMYGPMGERKPPAATIAQILSATPKAGGPAAGPAPQAPSAPLTDFEGLDFNPALTPLGLQFIPPDTNGAVGPNHVVVVSNTEVRYLTLAGVEIAGSRRTINDFWNTFGGAGWVASAADHAYDVKIFFDQESQRFFFVSLAAPSRPNAQYLLAVSRSADPTGGWWTWHWDYSAGDTRWIDYPGLGVSSRWVALTANIYTIPGVWVGVHGMVWSKAQLLNGREAAGGEAGVLYKLDLPPASVANWDLVGTVMPLYNFDANSPDLYMLQTRWPIGPAPHTQLRLYSITGADLAAVHTDLGLINVTAYGLPPDARQQGTATLLATGDQRMLTVIRRNGILYATHTAGCPAAAPTHACVAWYAINPAGPAVVQQGQVDGGTIAYWFPSIAVDPYDNVALGFSGSSENQYVGGYYTGRRATDALGTMQAPFQFRQGYNSYVKLDGAGENRWGDYSATAPMPDPASDGAFWTLQEVAAATPNQWSLWWAKFTLFPILGTSVSGLTATADANSISIAWNAHADATSYDVLRVNVPADDCGTGTTVQSAANPRAYTTPATLTPNQRLKMCVRPANPNGTGPFASITTGTYAAAVTGFGLTATATSITAAFTPPGAGQASGYQAEAFQSGTCTGTPDRVVQTSDPAATSILIGGVASETTYCVRVGALSAMGHLTYAAGSNITTDTLLVPPESKAPSSITDASMQANWGSGGNPNNTLYTMTYSATAGFPPASSTPTTTTTDFFAAATVLVPNTVYHFKVRPGTNGPETILPDAITLAQAPTTLSLPAGHPTDAAATLSWDVRSNPGDTSFVLEYATNESFTGATANTYLTSPQTLALGSPNTQYYFRVKAVSRAPANVSTAWATTSGATLPKPPLGPTYDSITFSSVTVRWNAPVSGTTLGFRAEAGSGAGDFTPPVPYAQTGNPAARVISVTGLSDNTPYLLRVGSLGIDGRLNWANLGYSTRTSTSIRSSETVTAAGAVLSFTPSFPEATNVTLVVPGGALRAGTKVTVNSSVQFMMGRPASNQAKISPLGPMAAVDIQTDDNSATDAAYLTFTYNPASIPAGRDETTLRVCNFNDSAQVWNILPSDVDGVMHTLRARLPHFSLWGPFFVTAGSDLSGVQVSPVPWEPGSGSPFDAPGITFTSLPPSADVKIFTLRGELVWEAPADLAGVLRWDGRTRKGTPAASGVYLVSIVSGGQKKLTRVVITR